MMPKLWAFAIALAALLISVSAKAADLSVVASAAAGEESSIAYDLGVQSTFEPWYEGEYFNLSPMITGGVLAWDRSDKTIWGVNAGGGLFLEFCGTGNWKPFVSASFGPVWISSGKFGDTRLGTHLQFRTRGAVGARFGDDLRHGVMLHVSHFSNAGINSDNDGYNTIGLSYIFTF